MLLFEHKQYLQSYDTESSMQTDILSFYIMAFNAYKNGPWGIQRVTFWVGDITNPDIYINLREKKTVNHPFNRTCA